MWNWNIRQRLFVHRAIGSTGRSTTSPYQTLVLGNAPAQSSPVELSSTELDLSKSRPLFAATPLGTIPLLDAEELEFTDYCAECENEA